MDAPGACTLAASSTVKIPPPPIPPLPRPKRPYVSPVVLFWGRSPDKLEPGTGNQNPTGEEEWGGGHPPWSWRWKTNRTLCPHLRSKGVWEGGPLGFQADTW